MSSKKAGVDLSSPFSPFSSSPLTDLPSLWISRSSQVTEFSRFHFPRFFAAYRVALSDGLFYPWIAYLSGLSVAADYGRFLRDREDGSLVLPAMIKAYSGVFPKFTDLIAGPVSPFSVTSRRISISGPSASSQKLIQISLALWTNRKDSRLVT